MASHSLGAYLAGILLKDVFDLNPQLREKLVVALDAGISSNYTSPGLLAGGWWQNIPFCSQFNECCCVMNWRSCKVGQTPPPPQNSSPNLNPFVLNNGWIYTQLNLSQNWTMQDSLYYNNQLQPLRNFITLRMNDNFGGNVGYVAFDSLYSIQHQRSGLNQVGFVVQHSPKPNDQKSNLLLSEETNPLNSNLGYHQKDYNIYTWALLDQIDVKLSSCENILKTTTTTLNNTSLTVFPNPANDFIYTRNNQVLLENENVDIMDYTGKIILSSRLNSEGGISIKLLNNGLYFLKQNLA